MYREVVHIDNNSSNIDIVIDKLIHICINNEKFNTNIQSILDKYKRTRKFGIFAQQVTALRRRYVVLVEGFGNSCHGDTINHEFATRILRYYRPQLYVQRTKIVQSKVWPELLNDNFNKTTQEKQPMSIKVETRTFVNGTDAISMKDNELFSLIAEQEKAISALVNIEHQPEKLVKRVNQMKKEIQELIVFIDSRD